MIAIPEAELVEVSKLKLDGDNPNRMTDGQIARLKTSIEKYGFIVPIITNRDLLVADGEQRLTAARSLGMERVPVIRLPVEDVDRRLLRQVLNKLRGEHELIADAYEFERIISAGHEDELKHLLDLSDSQLERYLTEIREPKDESYEIPEIDKIKTDIKRGDIFRLGSHRLMCGDATNREDVSRLMDGEKADMVFTDPPYGAKTVQTSGVLQGKGRVGFTARTAFGKVGFSGKVKHHKYYPVIGDDADFDPKHLLDLAPTLLIFGGNYFADKLPNSRCWYIWDKTGDIYFQNDFADVELIWTNLDRPARVFKFLWHGICKEGPIEKRYHPTQKPIRLLRRIMRQTITKETLVLDPYGGSGSTLIACEQTGRTCYMMEIDPRYCQVIIDRWQSYAGQKAEKLD